MPSLVVVIAVSPVEHRPGDAIAVERLTDRQWKRIWAYFAAGALVGSTLTPAADRCAAR